MADPANRPEPFGVFGFLLRPLLDGEPSTASALPTQNSVGGPGACPRLLKGEEKKELPLCLLATGRRTHHCLGPSSLSPTRKGGTSPATRPELPLFYWEGGPSPTRPEHGGSPAVINGHTGPANGGRHKAMPLPGRWGARPDAQPLSLRHSGPGAARYKGRLGLAIPSRLAALYRPAIATRQALCPV